MNSKFEPIDKVNVYNDDIGYVELWPSWVSNVSQQNREMVASTIATLSYGNEAAKNPQRLYQDLITRKHSSVFEFIVNATTGDSSSNLRNDRFNTWEEIGFDDNTIQTMVDLIKSKYSLFKIKAPMFVVRQMFRHRSSSILEQSRRYVKASKKPFEFYKYEENKEFYNLCVDKYNSEIAKGKLPEEARIVIPASMYTEFFWMNNYKPIEGLKNFFGQRLDEAHAQPEIVTLAKTMYNLIEMYQPELFNQIKL